MKPNNGEKVFITIPAATKPRVCRGMSLGGSCCKRIYLGVDPTRGTWTAVDCDVPGGRRPSESRDKTQRDLWSGEVDVHDGRGVRHHPNCPDAALIKRELQRREREGAA